jgi:lysyl-tRNA synthetase class 2
MSDVENLMSRVFERFRINSVGEPTRPFPRLSYGEACERYLGLDAAEESVTAWSEALARNGIDVDASQDREFLESVAYAEVVEPALFELGPCFIVDYPVRHAALARRKHDDETVSERVEFYLPFRTANGESRGLELANGFSELLDPEEQRQRFESDAQQLSQRAARERPTPEHVLSGISKLSETAGMALGVTRLAMWIGQQIYDQPWSVRDFYFGVR